MSTTTAASPPLGVFARFADRFDADVLDHTAPTSRLRLSVVDGPTCDALVSSTGLRLEPVSSRPARAELRADVSTWEALLTDPRASFRRFADGSLQIRGNAQAAFSFLAATTGDQRPGRLRWGSTRTRVGRVSYLTAGTGDPLLCIHGLGGTKVSMLPLVAALARTHRVVAVDLPGFGESSKPIRGRYDAVWFATALEQVLDALGLDETHLLGHSLGGRVALELALRQPERINRLVLLTPSLSWLRRPAWQWLVRLAPARLGAIQPTPHRLTERLVYRLVTARGGRTQAPWVQLAVDEFLRGYGKPGGRVAFYSAARNIVLDDPLGPHGLWTRLTELSPDVLFVWGRRDSLVPARFQQHVERRLPRAAHLVLDCGHLPQVERPGELLPALERFLATGRSAR